MMKSEFIERTGFEPTADEYAEIEAEYMGTDIDKDQFCKNWKKNGGAERLMRRRAYRIEELEAELVKKNRQFEERTLAGAIKYRELYDKDRQKMEEKEQLIEEFRHTIEVNAEFLSKETLRANEAERKLAVLREAFAIITGKEYAEELGCDYEIESTDGEVV